MPPGILKGQKQRAKRKQNQETMKLSAWHDDLCEPYQHLMHSRKHENTFKESDMQSKQNLAL